VRCSECRNVEIGSKSEVVSDCAFGRLCVSLHVAPRRVWIAICNISLVVNKNLTPNSHIDFTAIRGKLLCRWGLVPTRVAVSFCSTTIICILLQRPRPTHMGVGILKRRSCTAFSTGDHEPIHTRDSAPVKGKAVKLKNSRFCECDRCEVYSAEKRL
jgi:hypothetical protein